MNFQNLNSHEIKLLFSIFRKLVGATDQDTIGDNIADDILCLFKSDILLSCMWHQDTKSFSHIVTRNVSREHLAIYQGYYQFHDPIPRIEEAKARRVADMIPQKELERTEFFNDFLMKDGLHHGMGGHVYEGSVQTGDLRIWRTRHRPDFGKHEVDLLDTLLPYFQNALRNARILTKVRAREVLWMQLLEKVEEALFLFDDNDALIYRNAKAGELERQLSTDEYLFLYRYIFSGVKKRWLPTQWGPFTLSMLKSFSPQNGLAATAVIVQRSDPKNVDATLLRNKCRLTAREAEICMLVCKGLTNREVAATLGISSSTVQTHMKHIFVELDVTTRSELVYRLLSKCLDISF